MRLPTYTVVPWSRTLPRFSRTAQAHMLLPPRRTMLCSRRWCVRTRRALPIMAAPFFTAPQVTLIVVRAPAHAAPPNVDDYKNFEVDSNMQHLIDPSLDNLYIVGSKIMNSVRPSPDADHFQLDARVGNGFRSAKQHRLRRCVRYASLDSGSHSARPKWRHLILPYGPPSIVATIRTIFFVARS